MLIQDIVPIKKEERKQVSSSPKPRQVKKASKKALPVLLIAFLIIQLIGGILLPFSEQVSAVPVIDQDAGTWQDTFSDSAGISSSSNVTVGDGDIKLTPFSTTHTTRADFNTGTKDGAQITSVSGGELALAGTTTVYNAASTPSLPGNSVYHSWKDANGDVYVSTGGGGLTIIHSDDTTTIYNTGSTPSLPDNDIYHSWKDTNGDIYVSTWGGGLTIIHSDNTTTVYNTGSTPSLPGNNVVHSWKDTNGDVYVSNFENLNFNGGLTIIHSDNTTTVYNTTSTPSLPHNSVQHSWKDTNDDVYVSVEGSLTIIHSDNTTTVYNTTSTPSLPYYVQHSWKDTNGDVYVSANGGLTVIHPDDTTTIYNIGSTPSLPSNDIRHSWKDTNGDVYVSTNGGGLAVIHSDNTITVYNTTSTPSLPDNDYVQHSWKDTNGDVYVTIWTSGLTVIHSSSSYALSGSFTSPVVDVGSSVDFNTINWTEDLPSGTDATFQTRTAATFWRDDFDDGDISNVDGGSILTLAFGWGGVFQNISEEDGILTFSNATTNDVPPQIDTGYPADYFPAGSIVRARVKMTTSTTDPWFGMFTDEWDNGYGETYVINNWIEISYTETTAFNKIGFDVWGFTDLINDQF
ncbi:hypothetical protein KAT63_02920, partial [Candidatus Parcubacteria bacterium]|nr:hypothetical protein [Candidatus Parcubacteria bacterium]